MFALAGELEYALLVTFDNQMSPRLLKDKRAASTFHHGGRHAADFRADAPVQNKTTLYVLSLTASITLFLEICFPPAFISEICSVFHVQSTSVFHLTWSPS
jgi:hypothetical protein